MRSPRQLPQLSETPCKFFMHCPAAGIAPPVRMPHDKRPWLKSCFQPDCPTQAPPVVAANAKTASAAPRKLALACVASVAFPTSCDAAAAAKQTSNMTQQRRAMALPMLELARRGLMLAVLVQPLLLGQLEVLLSA
eukprot:CAMPEP_0203971368 /NCGR_PEP_ID=MMETSP0359-20131031/98441_1 /ASSEMBLY_ACC=CAM_ASM_000338 /TAXON_ID=268821 /ORGANISM="Scrippsiella Hangoei, Strain SHTV-5" /LENGTH=135 /DNA_ID=CAMNT_0050909341 /DNA_START=377 /DNA_END=784 /DNA_ORIENTATION=-